MASYEPNPAACPYAVFEVKNDDDEVLTFPVATKWLKDLSPEINDRGHYQLSGTIYWPSDDNLLADMLVKRPTPEDSTEWEKGSGKILQFFRTLGAAKVGAEKAEYESSIESDGVIKNSKRHRNPPSRYVEEESEEEINAQRMHPKRLCNRGQGSPLLLDKSGSADDSFLDVENESSKE